MIHVRSFWVSIDPLGDQDLGDVLQVKLRELEEREALKVLSIIWERRGDGHRYVTVVCRSTEFGA